MGPGRVVARPAPPWWRQPPARLGAGLIARPDGPGHADGAARGDGTARADGAAPADGPAREDGATRADRATDDTTADTTGGTTGPDRPDPARTDARDPDEEDVVSVQQDEPALLRREEVDADGPVELTVELGAGRLEVRMIEPGVDVAPSVQVRADGAGASPLASGITGLLSWLGEQTGAAPAGTLGAEAVRQTRIDVGEGRVTVRSPRDLPLRSVPLQVVVRVPAGSAVVARAGSADLVVDGVAGRLELATASGDVSAQRCTGPAEVRTGSGDVRLGSVLGVLRARTGSGELDAVSLEGGATLHTGSGDVRLGAVSNDVTARTGSGDLTVVAASAGWLELTTGSGELRVGVAPGTTAELDVSSGSGRVRSELPVSAAAPQGATPLRVRARTGSGDALVTPARA